MQVNIVCLYITVLLSLKYNFFAMNFEKAPLTKDMACALWMTDNPHGIFDSGKNQNIHEMQQN